MIVGIANVAEQRAQVVVVVIDCALVPQADAVGEPPVPNTWRRLMPIFVVPALFAQKLTVTILPASRNA